MSIKPSKKPNRYIVLTSIAAQLGITVYLAAELGKYLDLKYDFEKPLFTMLCILSGLAASMYLVLKQLKRLDQE